MRAGQWLGSRSLSSALTVVVPTVAGIYWADSALDWGLALSLTLVMAALVLWQWHGVGRVIGGEPEVALKLARAMVEGDLAAPLPAQDAPPDSLIGRLDAARRNLGRTLGRLREDADRVAGGAERLSAQSNEIGRAHV